MSKRNCTDFLPKSHEEARMSSVNSSRYLTSGREMEVYAQNLKTRQVR